MAKYRKIENGKPVTGEYDYEPKYKEQRYEGEPTFESVMGGDPGRGTQGLKHSKVGAAEYERPPMSKKWIEK